jgi:hypothetical protein
MSDEFMDQFLIDEYEAVAGPVDFTLSRIGPDREAAVTRLMREVIDGKRPPLIDAVLNQAIPDDAEI